MEGHAVTVEEEAAHARRVDVERPQIGVAEAPVRLLVHRVEQRSQPSGRRLSLERPAPQARTVAGEQRLAYCPEEFDVLEERLARPAGGPAEDAGRADAGDEDAVVAGVALEERALHFLTRRLRRGEERRLTGGSLGPTHDGDHELTLPVPPNPRYRKLDAEF